jgi:hypothetical protein
MRYFASPTQLDLHSDFDSQECSRRLREVIDAEKPTAFGFSGYRGSKPFLGEVDENQFRVLKRIYRPRNSFPVVLTGEFHPQGRRTRVKAAFDLELTSKIAICLFSAVGLLIMVPIVIYSSASHPALSAVFVCGYGGLLLFSPRIFRGYGRDQEKDIADFLRMTLQAKDNPSHSPNGRDV